MPTVRRFEDLVAYRRSHALAVEVFQRTDAIWARSPDLCRQARRSAVSVVSNVAEGFERGARAEFLYFIGVARGSAGELRAQLRLLGDLGYLPPESQCELISHCEEVSRILSGLARYLKATRMKGARRDTAKP